MFALGNSLFTCSVRSARERSFQEARGETEVGRRRLPSPLAPEPSPLPPLAPWTRPAGTQTSDLRGRYFAWNWTILVVMLATVVATTATLSSNSCKSATVFWHILLLFCGNISPLTTCFLGKRTVTRERSC